MSFHAEKGEIFIGPNGFKIEAKNFYISGIQGTGGTTPLLGSTTTVDMTLGGTIAEQGRYHRRTTLLPVVLLGKSLGATSHA